MDPVTAARIFHQAPQQCTADCAWYHRLWPYLRLLGLASTPLDDADFYARELATLRRGAHLLVSATADHAPMELVAAAAPHLRVTVMDRCATPLALCSDYASAHGLKVATTSGDVRTWRPAQPVDGVFTHGLLARFDPQQQMMVIRAWHDSLRPGGRVLAVTRLDSDPDARGAGFSAPDELLAAMTAGLRARGIEDPAVEAAARVYARRFTRHAPADRSALERAFEAAGLRVQRADTVVRRTTPGLDGAGTQQRSYAQIVAVRS